MQRNARPTTTSRGRLKAEEADATIQPATLQILRERFLRGLAHRVDRMEVCLIAMREDSAGDRAAWALGDLTRHFHNLAGIAGTFGCDAVTRSARRGERTCMKLADGSVGTGLETLVRILDELRRDVAVAVM